jgi:hypothetical protein
MEIKDFRIISFQIKNGQDFYSECLESGEFECRKSYEKSLDSLITRMRSAFSKTHDSLLYDSRESSSKKVISLFESSPYSETINAIVKRPISLGGEFKAKFKIHRAKEPQNISYTLL